MRVNTSTSNVQVQFANADTHSSDTEISETQDTRTIGDHEDLRRGDKLGCILAENLGDSVLRLGKKLVDAKCNTRKKKTHLVFDVEVKTFRSRVDLRILLTSLTNGRSVNDGRAEKRR